MSGFRQFRRILGALLKNKLRFDAGASTKKKVGFIALFLFAYISIEAIAVMISVTAGQVFSMLGGFKQYYYFIILLVCAAIVLVFGIVHLVATLFLAKDTDFYSALPIKSSVVFAAKTLYVYLFEAAIVAAVALPAMIVYGALTKAGVAYYFITVLSLPIVPALPLALAAIFAVPVMFIARKLRNRNIIPIIFYCLLFGGMLALYIVPMASMSTIAESEEITFEQIAKFAQIVTVIGYILYPYTVLSTAAFGVDTFELGGVASTALNILIFVGISAVLITVLLLLGKFMYSQAVKANNQTDNSRAKKGEYKRATQTNALIKREYLLALRTPSTMFQCYFSMLLPIIFAIIFSFMFKSMASDLIGIFDSKNISIIVYSAVFMMMPVISNAAITSFSREGMTIEALKSAPIEPRTLVRAKILAWSFIGVPVGVISATIVNIFLFDPLQLALSIVAFLLLPYIYISFGVLWDMSAPKLSWTDPLQAIKHNSHSTIGQLIGIGTGAVMFMTAYFIVFFTDININILFAVMWSAIYASGAVFSVVSILMYRKINAYYTKMTV